MYLHFYCFQHDRQTLMFSATFPEEIQRLATKFLKNDYLFLAVGIVGGACSDVEQKFYQVQKFDKRNKLTELLHEGLFIDILFDFMALF